jgi:hypothetical protein
MKSYQKLMQAQRNDSRLYQYRACALPEFGRGSFARSWFSRQNAVHMAVLDNP